jgi:hypothetical protein
LKGNRSRAGGSAFYYTGRLGSVIVNNCTFDNNDHPNTSFAAIASGGPLTVRNSTFINNVSGCIAAYDGTAEVTHCTFKGNSCISGTVVVAGNIFDGSGTLGGSIVSQGYNLSRDGGGGFLTGMGDQINIDPKLDPLGLQNSGGPTQTIALMPEVRQSIRATVLGWRPISADCRGPSITLPFPMLAAAMGATLAPTRLAT